MLSERRTRILRRRLKIACTDVAIVACAFLSVLDFGALAYAATLR